MYVKFIFGTWSGGLLIQVAFITGFTVLYMQRSTHMLLYISEFMWLRFLTLHFFCLFSLPSFLSIIFLLRWVSVAHFMCYRCVRMIWHIYLMRSANLPNSEFLMFVVTGREQLSLLSSLPYALPSSLSFFLLFISPSFFHSVSLPHALSTTCTSSLSPSPLSFPLFLTFLSLFLSLA